MFEAVCSLVNCHCTMRGRAQNDEETCVACSFWMARCWCVEMMKYMLGTSQEKSTVRGILDESFIVL